MAAVKIAKRFRFRLECGKGPKAKCRRRFVERRPPPALALGKKIRTSGRPLQRRRESLRRRFFFAKGVKPLQDPHYLR